MARAPWGMWNARRPSRRMRPRRTAVELIDVGGGVVVAVLRYGGRAKLSGIEPNETFAAVLTIRDQQIVRGREYATRDEALEAAGLSE